MISVWSVCLLLKSMWISSCTYAYSTFWASTECHSNGTLCRVSASDVAASIRREWADFCLYRSLGARPQQPHLCCSARRRTLLQDHWHFAIHHLPCTGCCIHQWGTGSVQLLENCYDTLRWLVMQWHEQCVLTRHFDALAPVYVAVWL